MGVALAAEVAGRRGSGDAGAGHRRAGGRGLRRGLAPAVSRGHGPQPLLRPHLHPAEPAHAPARRDGQAEPAARGRCRQAARSSWTTRSSAAPPPARSWPLLRKAGATEVHLRISSPPIHHPCFYGIDTQIETELIASTHSVEEIREFVGADSLSFLSIAGVLSALDLPYDRFCFACFDGDTRCRSHTTRPATSSFSRTPRASRSPRAS